MEKINLYENVTNDNYEDFLERLIGIFRLSSAEIYIILSLKVENSDCIVRLSILNNNGDRKDYHDVVLNTKDDYYSDFLNKLVLRLEDECDIVSKDIVNLDGDKYVAFRLITKFNDMVTIDGLEEDYANNLLELKKEVVPQPKVSLENNVGASNIIGFIFMIISLVISLFFIGYFMK